MIFFIKHYIVSSWKPILSSLLLSLIQAVSIIPIALLAQRLFDQILPQKDVVSFYGILVFMSVLLIVNAVVAVANRYITLRVVKKSLYKVRCDLINQTLAMDMLECSTGNIETLHSHIVHDSERIDRMVSSLLTQCIPSLLAVIGVSCVLIYLSPTLALVTVFVVPLLFIAGKSVGKKAETWTRVFHKDFTNFSEGVFFILNFSELIKHSSAEDYEFKRQSERVGALRDSSHQMAWLTTAYSILQGNVALVGGIIVLFVGGAEVIRGSLSVGSLLSFYIALSVLTSNIRTITSSLAVMIEGQTSLNTLKPFFNILPVGKDQTIFSGVRNNISFEEVSFSHSPLFSLKDISFKINRGEITGLFGMSGIGKSTLVNLILRLYIPEQGIIYVDGVDLKTIDGMSYRSRIGVLSQHAFVFDGTIRENIIYGLEEVAEKEIEDVVYKSEVSDFVRTLSHGLNTRVGSRGMRLSGGQRQRIAIARALLRNPDLLILDEPDNNLDTETIIRILKKVQADKMTVLMITHRQELQNSCTVSYKLIKDPFIKLIKL